MSKEDSRNYRPSIKTWALLKFEDWLIHLQEEEKTPRKGWKNPLYGVAAAVGITAVAAGGYELLKPRSSQTRDIVKQTYYEQEGEHGFILQYDVLIDIDKQYYVFNKMPGLIFRLRDDNVKRLLTNLQLNLPKSEVAVVSLSQFDKDKNPKAARNYIESIVNGVLAQQHNNREISYIDLFVPRFIANAYAPKPVPNDVSKIKLSETLSLGWLGQIRELIHNKYNQKVPDYFTDQEVAFILNNLPIEVLSISPEVITQSLRTSSGFEVQTINREMRLSPEGIIFIGNEAIVNTTPGFTAIVAFDQLAEKLKNPAFTPVTSNNAPLITVFLPSTSNPQEFYRAQADFKEKLYRIVAAKFPGQSPQVNPIPVYDIIQQAYGGLIPTRLKELNYGGVALDITKSFFQTRQGYSSDMLTSTYQDRIFQILSIDDGLIQKVLDKNRVNP